MPLTEETLADERWELIPDLDYRYEASSLGRIRSYAPTKGVTPATPRILRGYRTAKGYIRVSVIQNGNPRSLGAHILVMLAHVGPRSRNQVVRHLDGNPSNNRLDNLAYGTYQDNSADQVRHGTAVRGVSHSKALLTESDVHAARRMYRTGSYSKRAVAEALALPHAAVSTLLNGRTWIWLVTPEEVSA